MGNSQNRLPIGRRSRAVRRRCVLHSEPSERRNPLPATQQRHVRDTGRMFRAGPHLNSPSLRGGASVANRGCAAFFSSEQF